MMSDERLNELHHIGQVAELTGDRGFAVVMVHRHTGEYQHHDTYFGSNAQAAAEAHAAHESSEHVIGIVLDVAQLLEG